jgi:hypothetical protein
VRKGGRLGGEERRPHFKSAEAAAGCLSSIAAAAAAIKADTDIHKKSVKPECSEGEQRCLSLCCPSTREQTSPFNWRGRRYRYRCRRRSSSLLLPPCFPSASLRLATDKTASTRESV